MMAIKSTMTARMQMSILSIALIVSLHQAQFAASDDKLRELARHGGIVTIKLIEAHVPDMDPLPLQKESDVMAKVYQLLMSQQLQRDQQSQSQQQQQQQNLSQFLSKSLICETQTIQDDNSPKFDKKCTTSRQVPSDVVLRVELYDSDKPAPEPDKIGAVTIRLADLLLRRQLDSNEKYPIEGLEFPKYYLKANVDMKRDD